MMAEEVWFFGRSAAYGLAIGIVYWFVSYDIAGTILLVGFGIAAGVGFGALAVGARAAGEARADDAGGGSGNGPFASDTGAVPTRSAAPLVLGVGLALVSLAGAFGMWFLIAGLVPLALGAVDWLRAAGHELGLLARIAGAPPRATGDGSARDVRGPGQPGQ